MQLSRNRSVMRLRAARMLVASLRPRGQEKFSDSTFADVVRRCRAARAALRL